MRRIRALIYLSTALVVLAACSHTTPVAGPPPAASAQSASAPATGPAANSAGGGGSIPNPGAVAGQLDVSKLCAAVPQADVQKLFKATAPAVTANPLECDWGAGGVTVDIYFNDPTKHYLSDLFGSSPTPLAGVGDFAEWSQPVPGETVPFVGCHRGTTSITVSPGLDVDQTTLTYTGSDPFYKVDPASAAQYAAEEGAICTALFTAGA
jgi:hypothetical protein